MEYFMDLLKKHAITAVCDVRSQPYSRFNPQFNRENLRRELKINNIAYVFLGKELGARSENLACYIDGKVQYNKLADEPLFQKGINRLAQGMEKYSVTLLCAEKDPVTCHRMILVCRKMRSIAGQINHILASGEAETNSEAEDRLMNKLRIIAPAPLKTREECIEEAIQLSLIPPDPVRPLKTREECVEEAYDKQGQRIAYVQEKKQVATD